MSETPPVETPEDITDDAKALADEIKRAITDGDFKKAVAKLEGLEAWLNELPSHLQKAMEPMLTRLETLVSSIQPTPQPPQPPAPPPAEPPATLPNAVVDPPAPAIEPLKNARQTRKRI